MKLNISMAEIEGRENFEKFSKYVGSNSQEGGYFVGAGRYLLLHFDLHRPQNDTPKKVHIYEEIKNFIKSKEGSRLGGSVFFIPLPDTETSEKYAITLWNKMSELLDGKLSQGDSFFLHYAPDIKNQIGGISQVITDNDTTLSKVKRRFKVRW